jgi:hypothetical protein
MLVFTKKFSGRKKVSLRGTRHWISELCSFRGNISRWRVAWKWETAGNIDSSAMGGSVHLSKLKCMQEKNVIANMTFNFGLCYFWNTLYSPIGSAARYVVCKSLFMSNIVRVVMKVNESKVFVKTRRYSHESGMSAHMQPTLARETSVRLEWLIGGDKLLHWVRLFSTCRLYRRLPQQKQPRSAWRVTAYYAYLFASKTVKPA